MKSAFSLHAGSSQEYSKSTNKIDDEKKQNIKTKKKMNLVKHNCSWS